MATVSESAPRAARPSVSVVVVSYNTPRTLEKCLASLSRQPATEILVMDCSDEDPGAPLRQRFPAVEFRHFAEKLSIPQMRREGIFASKGEVVALTESWMEPCAGWVDSLQEAHYAHPEAAAVGGPIAFPCDGENATLLGWADYFSEYGEQVPGAVEEPASPDEGGVAGRAFPSESISGANCSYKRWAVEECRDLIAEAAWEPVIHGRLLERGHELWRAAGARVCYSKPARLGELLRQRFHYGRGHGAARGRGESWIGRVARGAGAPLVPWVLLWRVWRGLPAGAGLGGRLLASAGWVLALNTSWALGEAAGSWFGPGRGGPEIH